MDTSIVKVQVKALANEAVLARQIERKALEKGRIFRVSAQAGENVEPTKEQEQDSLASQFHYERYWNMHHYRVHSLRRLARATQLAYAFMRGKSYDQTEKWKHTAPSWNEVEDAVFRLIDTEVGHDELDPRLIKQRLEAWLQEAKGVA